MVLVNIVGWFLCFCFLPLCHVKFLLQHLCISASVRVLFIYLYLYSLRKKAWNYTHESQAKKGDPLRLLHIRTPFAMFLYKFIVCNFALIRTHYSRQSFYFVDEFTLLGCHWFLIHYKTSANFCMEQAALCSIRITKKVPDLVENFVNPAAALLKEKHHGVLITGVQLCTELCKLNEDALDYFRKVSFQLH